MIKDIHHITINIKDLEASHRFYGQFLGLERLEDVDMGDHSLHYYALPGGAKLELIAYAGDTGDCVSGLLERGRFRHLALVVDDMDYLCNNIENYGGRMLQLPRWVEELRFTGALAEDPNGCELEFVMPEVKH